MLVAAGSVSSGFLPGFESELNRSEERSTHQGDGHKVLTEAMAMGSVVSGRRRKRVLLVEPEYRAKYPPLGLMKISTFHKNRGDEVVFHKGTSAAVRDQNWDRIYISTLFTFQWRTTIETIRFYTRNRTGVKDIWVGGILASLLPEDLERETGITPHVGLWDEVDRLVPDYALFDGKHRYPVYDASIGYMTKGCVNRCDFCAVPDLEPWFVPFIPLAGQIDSSKRDLILLDNNVLASDRFTEIVDEIERCGFKKGSKLRNGQRYVDFNQGVDLRRLTEDKMALLSRLPLKPLRIAFDHIGLKTLYVDRIEFAQRQGITRLSNYILFNYTDTPEDFYERLRINIELNQELGLSIFSFPMKYVPLDAKDRKFVGDNWTRQQLRGIQCVLHATHGVVGARRPFFEKAFGRNVSEFLHIIEQPEERIFDRSQMTPFEIDQQKELTVATPD